MLHPAPERDSGDSTTVHDPAFGTRALSRARRRSRHPQGRPTASPPSSVSSCANCARARPCRHDRSASNQARCRCSGPLDGARMQQMPPGLEHTCDLQHRDPEILDVPNAWPEMDDVSRSAGHLVPHVRRAQNDVNVGTGGHRPGRCIDQSGSENIWTVAAVHVLTANIQDA